MARELEAGRDYDCRLPKTIHCTYCKNHYVEISAYVVNQNPDHPGTSITYTCEHCGNKMQRFAAATKEVARDIFSIYLRQDDTELLVEVDQIQ